MIEHDPKANAGSGQTGETYSEKIRRLERELAAANKEKAALADALVNLYEELRAVGCAVEVTNAVSKHNLSPIITRYRNEWLERDRRLRHSALLQMTRDQAKVLGLLSQWREVHQGVLPKDRQFQEAMRDAGFPVGSDDE